MKGYKLSLILLYLKLNFIQYSFGDLCDNEKKICNFCQADFTFVYDIAYYPLAVPQSRKLSAKNFIVKDLLQNICFNKTIGSRVSIMVAGGGTRKHVDGTEFREYESEANGDLNSFDSSYMIKMFTPRILEIMEYYQKQILPNVTKGFTPVLISIINANHPMNFNESLFNELTNQGVHIKFVVVYGDMSNVAGFGRNIFDGKDQNSLNNDLVYDLFKELIPKPTPRGTLCSRNAENLKISVLTIFDSTINEHDALKVAGILEELKMQSGSTEYSFLIGDNTTTQVITTPGNVTLPGDIVQIVNSSIIPRLTNGDGINIDEAITQAYFYLKYLSPKIRPVVVLVARNMSDSDYKKTEDVAKNMKEHLNVAVIILRTNPYDILFKERSAAISSRGMSFDLLDATFEEVSTAFFYVGCFCNQGKQFTVDDINPSKSIVFPRTTYYADCIDSVNHTSMNFDDTSKQCRNWADEAIPLMIPSAYTTAFIRDQMTSEKLEFYLSLKRRMNSTTFEWKGYDEERLTLNPSQLQFVNPNSDGNCVIASMNESSSASIWKVVPCEDQYVTDVLCQAHACDSEYPCDFYGRFDTNFSE